MAIKMQSPAGVRGALAALIVGAGVVSNLGSSSEGTPFALIDPYAGPKPSYQCAANSDKLTVTGDLQNGAAGAPLPKTLGVKASCTDSGNQSDLPLYGRTVNWVVTSGGGLVNGAAKTATQTPKENESANTADANWSLGSVVGTQTLTAQLEGSSSAKLVSLTATSVQLPAGGSCATGGGGTNFVDNRRRVIGVEIWTLAGSPYRGQEVGLDPNAKLTIEPGVLVCVPLIYVPSGAALAASGTADKPVRFSVANPTTNLASLSLYSDGTSPVATTLLRYVQADNLYLTAENQALQIEDSRFVTNPGVRQSQPCMRVSLKTTASASVSAAMVVRRSVFDGYGGALASCEPAVLLDAQNQSASSPAIFEARVANAVADGVAVRSVEGAPTWAIKNCDISQNGGAGIVFDGSASKPGAVVTGCSLSRNKGPGVTNKRSATYVVNAAGNWWGDAAGPGGPAGGGLSAGVDATSPLAAPLTLGY
jgi:hypothetical protein